MIHNNNNIIQWVGSKYSKMEHLFRNLPKEMDKIDTFVDCFVGGGSVFMFMMDNFPHIKNIIINDKNIDLYYMYYHIKNNIDEFLVEYKKIQNNLDVDTRKKIKGKDWFCDKLVELNQLRFNNDNSIYKSALFLVLINNCFNGIVRYNKENKIILQAGHISILNNENIINKRAEKKLTISNKHIYFNLNISKNIINNLKKYNHYLQRVTILNKSYDELSKYTTDKTLFYLDPPYKELEQKEKFYNNELNDNIFNKELLLFCKKIDKSKWFLSNHDLQFFRDIFKDYYFYKFDTKRMMGHTIKSRKNIISEIIIRNYKELYKKQLALEF